MLTGTMPTTIPPAMTSPDRPRRVMPWGELPRGERPFDGLVVIDKDQGVTSHDIVGAVRRLAGTRKVGHAGTLDPMATGVLCVGVGRATKLLQYVTGTSKEYVATIRLGIETTTEDAEGEIIARRGVSSIDDVVAAIEEAMVPLRGEIMQVPSAVSAIKVDGKRSYDRVRAGEAVELAARPVTISRFDILHEPRRSEDDTVIDVDVVVQCSAGTYIRALARDLGDALGTGAHLTALRRTRVGAWESEGAAHVAELAKAVSAGESLPHVAMGDLVRGLFPVMSVSEQDADALRHGQFIARGESREKMLAAFCGEDPVALVTPRGQLLKPDLLLSAG